MADEERGAELPLRVRGATRAAPPTSVTSPSALSDELRQRIQAAVDAERSDPSVPKQEPPELPKKEPAKKEPPKQKPPKGINGKHGLTAKPEPVAKADRKSVV